MAKCIAGIGAPVFKSKISQTSREFINGKLDEDRKARESEPVDKQIEKFIAGYKADELANPDLKISGIGGYADQAKNYLDRMHLYLQAGAITVEQKKEFARELQRIIAA